MQGLERNGRVTRQECWAVGAARGGRATGGGSASGGGGAAAA